MNYVLNKNSHTKAASRVDVLAAFFVGVGKRSLERPKLYLRPQFYRKVMDDCLVSKKAGEF